MALLYLTDDDCLDTVERGGVERVEHEVRRRVHGQRAVEPLVGDEAAELERVWLAQLPVERLCPCFLHEELLQLRCAPRCWNPSIPVTRAASVSSYEQMGMRCTRGRNPRVQGEAGAWVPCALDSARRRLRRARASARLVSARRRCSGESEEGEELEEREAAGAAVTARRRLAGRAKKSAMVLGAVAVGGDGAIGSGFGGTSGGGGEGVWSAATALRRFWGFWKGGLVRGRRGNEWARPRVGVAMRNRARGTAELLLHGPRDRKK